MMFIGNAYRVNVSCIKNAFHHCQPEGTIICVNYVFSLVKKGGTGNLLSFAACPISSNSLVHIALLSMSTIHSIRGNSRCPQCKSVIVMWKHITVFPGPDVCAVAFHGIRGEPLMPIIQICDSFREHL